MINIRQKQHGWNLKKNPRLVRISMRKYFLKTKEFQSIFLWLCMTVVTVIVLKMDFERHLEIE